MPVTIFICSAREDKALLNELMSHLMPLQRRGLIEIRHDHDIPAGAEWEARVIQEINAAQVILLLVSPDFLNSDYCYHIEMQRALARHERGEARVIPIILRPVLWWEMPFSKLQALPTDGEPVTSPLWPDRDAAFYDIALGIYQVVKVMTLGTGSAQGPIHPYVAAIPTGSDQHRFHPICVILFYVRCGLVIILSYHTKR